MCEGKTMNPVTYNGLKDIVRNGQEMVISRKPSLQGAVIIFMRKSRGQ
jgi:hypothetical protein